MSRVATSSRALACLATAALAACAPAAAKGPDAVALPPDLLFSVTLGPASTLRGLQAYVEAVKPGAGALISEQIIRHQLATTVDVPSLDGLDANAGTYLMFSMHGDALATTLTGKVRDAKALAAAITPDHLTIQNGWAVIGNRVNVDSDAAYAFATFATQPTPKQPTATLYVPHLIARFQPQLSAGRKQVQDGINQSSPQMAAMFTGYFDGFASIGDDTDKVILTLDAQPDLASFDTAFVPKPKSRLAAFVAAQHPTDYGILGKLPASQPSVLAGGRMDLGPYHDGLITMMASIYDPSGSPQLRNAMEQLRKVMTGEWAFSVELSAGAPMQFTQLYGTTDSKLADKSLAGMLDLFKAGRTIEAPGVVTTIKSSPTTTAYDGVTLRPYDSVTDMSKATPAQKQAVALIGGDKPQHVIAAAFDKLTLVLLSKDSQADAQKAIDVARGKSASYVPSTEMRAQLEASRARKDSMAIIIDVAKIVSAFLPTANLGNQPVVMSIGAADHSAHLRFMLPAATLHGLASLKL